MTSFRLSLSALAGAWLLAGCASLTAPTPVARVTPPTDCTAGVGTDRNTELPGYRLPQSDGRTVCVPLLVTAAKPPAGYAGDYYLDEFTFRFNRRDANSRGLLFYRLIEQAANTDPAPLHTLLQPELNPYFS